MSVAYIGLKSRTERPRKTKIGTEVAHVTRDSDTTFKVKRSKFKVTRPLYSPPRVNASGSCSGDRGNVLTVGTYCYVAVYRRGRLGGARRFSAHRARRGAGAYCGSACLQLVTFGFWCGFGFGFWPSLGSCSVRSCWVRVLSHLYVELNLSRDRRL